MSFEEGDETGSEAELEYPLENDIEMDQWEEPSGYLSFLPVAYEGGQSFPSCGSTLSMPSRVEAENPLSAIGVLPNDFVEASIRGCPETYPPEISVLCKANDEGMPVSALMEADWTGSPFRLHDGCAFAVLGFFHIIDIQVRNAIPMLCM